MTFALSGYQLVQGTCLERARLLHFLSRTYAELSGTASFDHLADTVERHFSAATPVWWVTPEAKPDQAIAGLWLGNAIDQQQGDRHAYVLMLYVMPEYRRQGIATALLQTAQNWAQTRGDRQIGLQVFANNAAAIALYRKLGYEIHSHWLTRPLETA